MRMTRQMPNFPSAYNPIPMQYLNQYTQNRHCILELGSEFVFCPRRVLMSTPQQVAFATQFPQLPICSHITKSTGLDPLDVGPHKHSSTWGVKSTPGNSPKSIKRTAYSQECHAPTNRWGATHRNRIYNGAKAVSKRKLWPNALPALQGKGSPFSVWWTPEHAWKDHKCLIRRASFRTGILQLRVQTRQKSPPKNIQNLYELKCGFYLHQIAYKFANTTFEKNIW